MSEPVTIVKISQPLCALDFGVAPCTATGDQCYKTRATCKDLANYDQSATLDLYFAEGHVADMGVPGLPYVFPGLVSVSTTATKINVGGMLRDAKGLGTRANCKIVIKDFTHTDRLVDPYADARGIDVLSGNFGSFWTLWMARNRYRQNIVLTIYEGFAGQTLAQMTSRKLFWESITRGAGEVQIDGKDILARLEERKAQAPAASTGTLSLGISATSTSLSVENADIADYPASGEIRINDEVISYGSRSVVGGVIVFSPLARGVEGTEASEHDEGDAVQECLRLSGPGWQVLQTLMRDYGGIDPSWINTSSWQTVWENWRSFHNLSHFITEPTAVVELVAGLCRDCLVFVWWDERTSLVEMAPLAGTEVEPPLINERANIVAGSFGLREMPEERLTEVVTHFDLKRPAEELDDEKNYAKQQVNKNAAAQAAHGQPSIRTVYAYWLPTRTLAFFLSSRLLALCEDNPSEATFTLAAKDRQYWVGDTVRISHTMDRDPSGTLQLQTWLITSATDLHNNGMIKYKARNVTALGKVNLIMQAGAADYDPAVGLPEVNCYIGDSAGMLGANTEAARIA